MIDTYKWAKVTDPNYRLTKKDHGRILKVGKHNFRRISIIGEWDYWENGFVDCAYSEKKDKFIYKNKEGNWYEEINGAKKTKDLP